MKTTFLTDSFSTLGGLASVAYGDSNYFREVQNQIYANSVTQFMDMHRPSDSLENVWGGRDRLLGLVGDLLQTQYESSEEFADYVDVSLGVDWKTILLESLKTALPQTYDSLSEYQVSALGYLTKALDSAFPVFSDQSTVSSGRDPAKIATEILNGLKTDRLVGTDFDLFSNAINNNPQTKLHTPPIESRVSLENSVDLGTDYRGINFSTGYITPKEYWNDIAYPGFTNSNVSVLPTQFKDTILQGYYGYPSVTPLESLYNPLGATSVYSMESNGGGAFSSGSVLGQIPEALRDDISFFPVSLIGEAANNFLSGGPPPIITPTSTNADQQGGVIPSARTFTPLF